MSTIRIPIYDGIELEVTVEGCNHEYKILVLGAQVLKGGFKDHYTNENGQRENDNYSADFDIPPGQPNMIWNPLGKRIRIRILKADRGGPGNFSVKGNCIYEECSNTIQGWNCSSWKNLEGYSKRYKETGHLLTGCPRMQNTENWCS